MRNGACQTCQWMPFVQNGLLLWMVGIEDLAPTLSPISENFATVITPAHVMSPHIPTFKP